MNPFTRFLSRRLGQGDDLLAFIERWDALERLVIRVYKGRAASAADETEYGELRDWLRSRYAALAPSLLPYWQDALVGGQQPASDPFASLLLAESAQALVGDWQAMQRLPAAREALNRLILARRQPGA
jgi:hypothetical protein